MYTILIYYYKGTHITYVPLDVSIYTYRKKIYTFSIYKKHPKLT